MCNFFYYSVKGHERITIDGIGSGRFLETGGDVKTQGVWTSICLALDFANDTTAYYANGKAFEGKISSAKPLRVWMSNNTDLPMLVRIGHYYFDNKPMIGRIIDMNMWSRWVSQFSSLMCHNQDSVHLGAGAVLGLPESYGQIRRLDEPDDRVHHHREPHK